MAKIKKDVTNAAPKNVANEERGDAFMTRLFNDPATKALNPGLKWVNGRFESEPDKPRPPLPDPGGKRRDTAMTDATCQMESILNAQIALLRMEDRKAKDGETAMEGPRFDMPDIIKALAIRGHALNSALMSAHLGEISTRELEGLVYRGEHPTYHDEPDVPVTKAAKSKARGRAPKIAATA